MLILIKLSHVSLTLIILSRTCNKIIVIPIWAVKIAKTKARDGFGLDGDLDIPLAIILDLAA